MRSELWVSALILTKHCIFPALPVSFLAVLRDIKVAHGIHIRDITAAHLFTRGSFNTFLLSYLLQFSFLCCSYLIAPGVKKSWPIIFVMGMNPDATLEYLSTITKSYVGILPNAKALWNDHFSPWLSKFRKSAEVIPGTKNVKKLACRPNSKTKPKKVDAPQESIDEPKDE